jgi:small neutral amino acid transporter SnatA (MarC family)
MPPLKVLFGPLTSYKSFQDMVSEQTKQTDNSWILTGSIIILGVLYLCGFYGHYKYNVAK